MLLDEILLKTQVTTEAGYLSKLMPCHNAATLAFTPSSSVIHTEVSSPLVPVFLPLVHFLREKVLALLSVFMSSVFIVHYNFWCS